MTGRLKDPRPTLERYDISESGCWEWAGGRLPSGYGYTSLHFYAHRHFYEEHVGPIPEGWVIDHLCMNKPCVNPAHLEAVTQQENVVRWWASRPPVTHCHNGHDKSIDGVMNSGRCRRCHREKTQRYRASLKAKAVSS